jgi:hypothetical protein
MLIPIPSDYKSGISNTALLGFALALAGYDATKEQVIAAFKFYVQEEARDYEREFPEQLHEEWYRLYQIPRPEKNRPWKFKHLTVDQVYKPLAKSSGKILRLTQEQRENNNARWKKLHQFLSEIGVAMWHEGKKILARAVSAHCFQCLVKVPTQTRYFHFDGRLSNYVIP